MQENNIEIGANVNRTKSAQEETAVNSALTTISSCSAQGVKFNYILVNLMKSNKC